MKLLVVGLILSLFVAQVPAQGTVEQFRTAIQDQFTRFSAFYDAMNNAMRNYRLAHVEEVSNIFNQQMQGFGARVAYVRESRTYVNRVVSDVLAELGGQPNACLNNVISRLIANSQMVGEAINGCAIRANRTMTYGLTDIFYPTFRSIQDSASTVPLATFDALSRGNVFDDSQEILDYSQSQYDVKVMQWLGAVSQLFRWDTQRFRVEGGFYVEEMIDCGASEIDNYSNTNTVLMFEAFDVCRVA